MYIEARVALQNQGGKKVHHGIAYFTHTCLQRNISEYIFQKLILQYRIVKNHILLSRSQLQEINFLNVETLPESPTQDGTDAILSFFVNLPGGTMPLDLLTTIFVSSPNIISRRSSAYVTEDIRNNAVSVLLRNYQPDQVISKTIIVVL